MIPWADVIGTAAALCSITSFAPQIIKIWKERDASSVSIKTYGLTVTCFILGGLWPYDPSLAGHHRQRLRTRHGQRRPDHEMAL